MIDTLYVNGCSWTAGNELECDPLFIRDLKKKELHLEDPNNSINWNLLDKHDQYVARVDELYDNYNWAGQVKKLLNIEHLVNDSIGGGSNARIVRTTCDYLLSYPAEKRKNLLVIIGWTVNARDELYLRNNWHRFNVAQDFSQTVDLNEINDKKYIKAIDKFQKDYTVLVHSDYANIKSYFQNAYMLAGLLDSLGINYFFFNALPAWWEGGHLKCELDVAEEFKQELAWHNGHDRIMNYKSTMYRFMHDKKLPAAPYGHPLVDGHKKWAKKIISSMKIKRFL